MVPVRPLLVLVDDDAVAPDVVAEAGVEAGVHQEPEADLEAALDLCQLVEDSLASRHPAQPVLTLGLTGQRGEDDGNYAL